jgi:hypothetical protein
LNAALASIYVALIGVIGGIITTIIQRFRKENKNDHMMVRDILISLKEDINSVDGKLDEHIQWHLEEKSKK